MNGAPSHEHPDDSVLADLVAGELDAATARRVEQHVLGCPACEAAVAASAGIRALLRSADPGPMPDDVWLGIESALTAEAVRGRLDGAGTGPRADWFGGHPTASSLPGSPPSSSPSSSSASTASGTGAVPLGTPPSPPPRMSFDEAPTAAWKRFLDEPEAPSPDTSSLPLHRARAVRAVRSRREARSDDRASTRRRRPLVFAAAAAGLVVLGGGGTVAVLTLGGNRTPAAVQDALPGAGSVVVASGRNYAASTLVQQVGQLMSSGRPHTSPAPSGAGTVADPAQLSSCLTGLGEHDRSPVAVDFARYQGRDAAVIVLSAPTGGYDVWVVPRDCRAGAENALAFKPAKASPSPSGAAGTTR